MLIIFFIYYFLINEIIFLAISIFKRRNILVHIQSLCFYMLTGHSEPV